MSKVCNESFRASYEAYVNVRDEEESAKLGAFSKNLQEIEDHLPIDPKYRNPTIGAGAIRVVNEVMSAGDGNHGVQTAAYNLPNDERVIAEKGSKRVMLKNVQQAKFDKTLIPISRMVLGRRRARPGGIRGVLHSHPHPRTVSRAGAASDHGEWKRTTPREQLKELYSPIEEAKADVTGLICAAIHARSRAGHGAGRCSEAKPQSPRSACMPPIWHRRFARCALD